MLAVAERVRLGLLFNACVYGSVFPNRARLNPLQPFVLFEASGASTVSCCIIGYTPVGTKKYTVSEMRGKKTVRFTFAKFKVFSSKCCIGTTGTTEHY